MAALLAQFIAAALVILVAGTFLTRYCDILGERAGLGRTVAGALLLATATSLPELAVDANLARAGAADLVLGDLLGSSLCNLLILAVLVVSLKSAVHIPECRSMAQTTAAILSTVLTAIVLLFILFPCHVTLFGIGPGPITLVIAYMLGLRLIFRQQQLPLDHGGRRSMPMPGVHAVRLRKAVVGYSLSTLGILVAAPILASAAERLAEASGLGGTFIGTTLVAASTSMPEAVTTYSAIKSGALDLAVGNIFGSNAFNMIITLPADAFFDGSLLASASRVHTVTATCVVLTTSVAVLWLLCRLDAQHRVMPSGAALIIVMVLGSLWLVYTLS